MDYEYKSLRPSQVRLDPENPRLPDGTSSDREAINRLLDDGAQALINLARDMAQIGRTNPAELPIAVKEGAKYLILEGNRRFAALKLLKDPELANNETHRKAFRRAAALGKPPTSVYTLVASSREEADHWIVLRHTGDNNGVGIKRWSAGQTATHRRRANATVDSGTVRSITISDDLEEAYAIDSELLELIRIVRRGKLTNIGRFFSPDVLTALSLSLDDDDSNTLKSKSLYVKHEAEKLRDLFLWIFRFLQDNSVDEFKNAKLRKAVLERDEIAHLLPRGSEASEYSFRLVDRSFGTEDPQENNGNFAPSADSSPTDLRTDLGDGDDGEPPVACEGSGPESAVTNGDSGSSLPSVNRASVGPSVAAAQAGPSSTIAPASSASGASPGSDAGSSGVGSSSGDTGAANSTRKAEAKPEQLLLQGLKLPNHPAPIQALLKECRQLDLGSFPGAACVLLRVLVELSVSTPRALSLSGAKETDSLKSKILNMLRHLDPEVENPRKRKKELDQAYMEVTTLGVQYMNSFVHNPSMRADQHLARRFSAAFRPLLQMIDGVL